MNYWWMNKGVSSQYLEVYSHGGLSFSLNVDEHLNASVVLHLLFILLGILFFHFMPVGLLLVHIYPPQTSPLPTLRCSLLRNLTLNFTMAYDLLFVIMIICLHASLLCQSMNSWKHLVIFFPVNCIQHRSWFRVGIENFGESSYNFEFTQNCGFELLPILTPVMSL